MIELGTQRVALEVFEILHKGALKQIQNQLTSGDAPWWCKFETFDSPFYTAACTSNTMNA